MTNSSRSSGSQWRRYLRWFEPGLGVKRWLLLMVLSTALIGLGLAVILLDIYRTYPGSPWLKILSLSPLPRVLRAVILGGSGALLLIYSAMRLNRSLMAPYVRPGTSVVETVAEHRRLERGPRIVAIGGGTGLSTLLRGLKMVTSNMVAIVTMADDGGSSGRLRRSLGLPPPGDLRNCLAALSDDEDLLTRLFQYRFLDGDELGGHPFGNLFIAALAGATGSFECGILEAGRVLAIRGKVIPATLRDIALLADKSPSFDARAVRIEGESSIPSFPGRITRVQLEPDDPPAYPEALRAILNADMVVIGPGSLYTSILPNLLVPDIVAALKATRAFRVFVCNVATQIGETDGFSCMQHVEAIETHIGKGIFDQIVANDCYSEKLPDGISWVQDSNGAMLIPIYKTDLIDKNRPSHHDPVKLSETLISLLEERTGPLDLPPLDDFAQVKGLN
ncbi:MAG: hypothetical protein A2Z14_09290 [Chloroflexi bacterium RBG_16_48_8]|nr:MAG: hypothetical protein A2Z14_09290 [Chloroflexi bacterium RBG_16_48_8]